MSSPNQHTIRTVVIERRWATFLRRKDAARDLGCSPGHIRNLIASGKLPAVTLDGLLLIRASDWANYTSTAQPIDPKRRTT